MIFDKCFLPKFLDYIFNKNQSPDQELDSQIKIRSTNQELDL